MLDEQDKLRKEQKAKEIEVERNSVYTLPQDKVITEEQRQR